MSRIFVKPTEQGLAWKLRDPVSKEPLPKDGGMVPDTNFWRRRIKNGDVVETAPPKATASKGASSGKGPKVADKGKDADKKDG